MPSGIDAVIANFGDYRQFRRLSPIFGEKNWRLSLKNIDGFTLLHINKQRFESKAPIFFGENIFPDHNIGPWLASHVIIFFSMCVNQSTGHFGVHLFFRPLPKKEQKTRNTEFVSLKLQTSAILPCHVCEAKVCLNET
jgi:hypothetical protein